MTRTRRWRIRPDFSNPRWRWSALIASVLMLTAMWTSARWQVELAFGAPNVVDDTWSVVARRGCLEFWLNNQVNLSWNGAPLGRYVGNSGLRLSIDRQYYDSIALPWRPYHASGSPAGRTYHGLVVPLWPVVVGAVVFTGFIWGRASGLKRSDHGRCHSCGYDLRKLPLTSPCPECGTARDSLSATIATAQPPASLSTDAHTS